MKIEDEELAILLKKLGIGIIVLLVFSTLIIIFFYNKFSPHIPKVITSIEKKETIYVFIENNSCKNCKEIKQILNDKKINYYTINIDKEKEYKLFLNKLLGLFFCPFVPYNAVDAAVVTPSKNSFFNPGIITELNNVPIIV